VRTFVVENDQLIPLRSWLIGIQIRQEPKAGAIRRRVRAELGLSISVGVACTKHLAKIASQAAKPDGLVVVDPGTELDFLRDLPVELMWGVGPVTKGLRAGMRFWTSNSTANRPMCRQIASADPFQVRQQNANGKQFRKWPGSRPYFWKTAVGSTNSPRLSDVLIGLKPCAN
jgi:impB/mucB/samB family